MKVLSLNSFFYSNKIYFFCLALVLATVNYPKHNINNISLILLLFFWFINFKYNGKEIILNIKKSRYVIVTLLFLACYLIALLYSNNLPKGFNVIKLKLPILIIPILLINIRNKLKKNQISQLKKIFIFSTLAYSLYTIVAVYLDFPPIDEQTYLTGQKSFFHSGLTYKIDNHPTYLSFSIIVSVIFLWDLIIKKQVTFSVFILTYIFFSTYIVLLSSKIGFVLFVIITIVYLNKAIKELTKKILVSIIFLISILSISLNSDLGERFILEYKSITSIKELKDNTIPLKIKPQRAIAIDIFFNQPINQILFGVGTGDTQDYLDKKYRHYLPTTNRTAFKKLNYHNQYLQTASSTGIIGLIILLLIIFYSFNKKKFNHMVFLSSLAIFFCFESFLETQRGVMLFILINSFYVNLFNKE